MGLVGRRVAAGIVDDRERVRCHPQRPKAHHQLINHRGELGHVGPVTRIGVAGDRHATVAGHDQPEADQAQIDPFLLGLAALGDRGALVA